MSKCKHRKWEIIRTIWPHEYGWCWMCRKCKMVIDFVEDRQYGGDKQKSRIALKTQGVPA